MEGGRVSVKDNSYTGIRNNSYTGTRSNKSGQRRGGSKRSTARISSNFQKENPEDRSNSREIRRELCSSGNPLRPKIKIKDDTVSSKNSLEVNLLPTVGQHFPLMQ